MSEERIERTGDRIIKVVDFRLTDNEAEQVRYQIHRILVEEEADAVAEMITTKCERLLSLNIRPVLVHYCSDKRLRFRIKGLRGLFGLKGMERVTGTPISLMWWRKPPKYK